MLIMLDRDGVINHESHAYIKSVEEFIPIPGSIEAIAKLKHAGHTVVVVTNQSGLARGLYTETTLAAIHAKLTNLLAAWEVTLDGIYYCPHHPEQQCPCRKPNTLLFKKIAHDFSADLTQAWFVGDRMSDLQAAARIGAQMALVQTGSGATTLAQLNHPLRMVELHDVTVNDLTQPEEVGGGSEFDRA